jgi:hypothetical protein
MNCNTSEINRIVNRNGYVTIADTIYDSYKNVDEIYRTFYQKKPTINNDFIQIKNRMSDNSYFFYTRVKNEVNPIVFKINDFDTFLNQLDYVLNSNLNNTTIALDSLEQTYIRKSLTFKKGIFFIHNYQKNKNIIFDLSENDIKILKEAYQTYLDDRKS